MNALDYLVGHCSDPEFRYSDPKVRTALYAVREDIINGRISCTDVRQALAPLLGEGDIQKCIEIIEKPGDDFFRYVRPLFLK